MRTPERRLKLLPWGSSAGLCLPWANFLVLSLTPDQTQGPPLICVHIFWPRWIPKQSMMAGFLDLLWPGTPSLSDPERSPCTHVVGVS